MEKLKTKSLIKELTDEDIKNGCFSVAFCSFERAIEETNLLAGVKNKPKGYYITEQGINICY